MRNGRPTEYVQASGASLTPSWQCILSKEETTAEVNGNEDSGNISRHSESLQGHE